MAYVSTVHSTVIYIKKLSKHTCLEASLLFLTKTEEKWLIRLPIILCLQAYCYHGQTLLASDKCGEAIRSLQEAEKCMYVLNLTFVSSVVAQQNVFKPHTALVDLFLCLNFMYVFALAGKSAPFLCFYLCQEIHQ